MPVIKLSRKKVRSQDVSEHYPEILTAISTLVLGKGWQELAKDYGNGTDYITFEKEGAELRIQLGDYEPEEESESFPGMTVIRQ